MLHFSTLLRPFGLRLMFALGLFFFGFSTLFAGDFTWSGGAATDDWQDALNWTLSSGVDDGANNYPDGADRALFNSAVTPTVTNLPASLAELVISDAGANVTLGGALNATALTIAAGTLTTGNNLISLGGTASVNGLLDASGQAGASTTSISGNLSGTGTATFGAGNVTVGNDVNITALTESSGTTSVLANFTVATLTPNGGTIDLSGSPTITVSAGSFNNLTTNGPTLGSAVTVGGDLSLTGTLTTGANNLTVGGNVTTPTTGNIDQSGGGSLAVTGITTINAGASVITLDNAANDFGGAVSLTTSGPNDVSIRDANALELGATTAQNLTAEVGGTLTQSGALNVAGNATVTASAAATDIELGTQANTFQAGIAFTNNGNIRDLGIRKDAGAATLPTFPGGLRDLFVRWNAGFTMPSLTATGTVALVAGAAVTQAPGGIQADGLEFRGTGPFTFTEANDVNTFAADTSGAVSFRDTDGFAVGTVWVASGINTGTANTTLDAGGAVSQTATITAGGLELLGAGAFNLTGAANDVDTIAGNVTNAVSFADSDDISIGTVNTVGLTATIFALQANGAVTQTQPLTVSTGPTSLDSGTGAITLTAANDFTGAVQVITAGGSNATIVDANDIDLGTSSVAGTLDVTSTAGSITDSGTVTAGGGSFTTNTLNETINLGTLDISGTVSVNTAGASGNATLVNGSALDLGASSVGGSLAATATTGNVTDSGTVTVAGDASFTASQAGADINLGTLDVAGTVTLSTNGAGANATIVNSGNLDVGTSSVGNNLDLTSSTGNLTQTGPVTVPGDTSLSAAGGSDINFGLANDFTGSVSVLAVSGTLNNVTLEDTTGLTLGAITTTGNLDVTVGGSPVNQTGDLTVGGDFTVTTTANPTDVELGGLAYNNTFQAGIDFVEGAGGDYRDIGIRKTAGAAALPTFPSGLRDLYIRWNSGFTMPSLSVSRDITIEAGGPVGQAAGGIQGAGLQLQGAGPYTLTSTLNDFDVIAADITEALTYVDADGLDVGVLPIVSGITTTDDNVSLTTLSAPAGDRDMTLTEPIDVGNATVTLDIAGDLDGDGAVAADIIAAAIDLDATAGIGETAEIDTSGVDSVDLLVTGDGGIDVHNVADADTVLNTMRIDGIGVADYWQDGDQQLTVYDVRTADGDIFVRSGWGTNADLIIDSVQGIVDDAGTNTVLVTAGHVMSASIVGAGYEISGGTVILRGDYGIGLATSPIDVLVTDTATYAAAHLTINAISNGDAFVRSGGDIPLDFATIGTGALTLESTSGAITEYSPDAAVDIDASAVDIDAANGIGATNQIEMANVATVNADVGTVGAISLSNVASAGVTAASITTPSGDVTYNQTGGQSLDVTSVTTGAGNVTITNAGGGGDIALASSATGAVQATATATVTSSNGSITAQTGTDVLEVSAPTIDLNAVNGNIGVVGGNQIDISATTAVFADTSTGNGDISITQPAGDLTLGLITTGSEASGDVELVAPNGGILDNGNPGVDIRAASAMLTARGATVDPPTAASEIQGIGRTDAIETEVGSLAITTTLADAVLDSYREDFVNIVEASGLTSLAASLLDGAITVEANGSVFVQNVRISTDAGRNDVVIETIGGASRITVEEILLSDGPVTVPADSADVILISGEAIIQSGTGPHITAGTVALVAGNGSIGTDELNPLIVSSTDLPAEATGSVYLTASGARRMLIDGTNLPDTSRLDGIVAGGEIVLVSTDPLNGQIKIDEGIRGGNITVLADGEIHIDDIGADGDIDVTGFVDIDTTGVVRVDGAILADGPLLADGIIDINATGFIDVNRRIASDANITLTTGSEVRIDNNVVTTTASDITVNGNVRIDNNNGFASDGGEIRITGEIDDQTAANHTLSFTTPGGDVYIEGSIGRNTRPLSVAFEAERVIFTGAADAADDDIFVDQQMSFTNTTHVRLEMQDNAAIQLGGTAGDDTFIWPIDLYVDLPVGITLRLQDNLDVQGRGVFYGGTTNLNGNSLQVNDDFAIFGTNYTADDPDWAGADTRWEHPDQKVAAPTGFYYDPSTPYNAELTLDGASVVGLSNFYVNGTNLNPGTGWTLSLPDGSGASPSYSATDPIANMGEPWAIALYSTVANSDLTGPGWVAAAVPAGGEQNNSVTDGGGNDTTGSGGSGAWDFSAPTIASAATVRDDTIRISFTDALRNSSNEVTTAVAGGQITFDSGGEVFDDVDLDDSGTALPSTNIGLASMPIYLLTSASWNTDADGGSTGDGDSTDESGNHQTTTPNIAMPKGTLFDANSRNFIRDYTAGGGGLFTGTSDEAPPALVRVVAGRHDHDETVTALGSYAEYDGHNFFELRYSEPVDIGGTDPSLDFLNAGSDTAPDDDASRRADPTFATDSDIGGYVHDAGGSGTVFVEGYFSYPGTFAGGSRDGEVSTSSIFRKDVAGVFNDNDDHYVTIVVKGFRLSPGNEWVGYIEDASDPAGQSISVPSNPYITDASGNPVLDDSLIEPANVVTIQSGALDWDVDPPIVAPFKPDGNVTGFRELVTVESGGLAQYIDHLDIHFLGNLGDQGTYDSSTDHPTPEQEGIRFYSFENALDDGALALGFSGDPTPPVLDATNTGTPSVESAVDNSVFVPPLPALPGPIDRYDDGYVRINIDEAVLQYGTQSNLWFFYTPSPSDVGATGIITDHAGNLVRALSQEPTIERQPPVFVGTLAIAGSTRVYVRFNEYVLGYDDGTGTQRALDDNPAIDLNQVFEIVDAVGNPAGVTITGVQLLQRSSVNPDAASDMFLELSGPVTQEGAVTWRIVPGPGPDTIQDPFTSPIASSESNRITNVALNVVQPSAAWNDIQREDLYGDEFQGIISANEFDGSGELLQRTTRLQLTILDAVNYGLPLQLFVDSDVPDRFTSNQFGPEFWLPQQSTLIAQPDTSTIEALPANIEANSYLPVEQSGGVAEFVIPESDPAISGGSQVELVPTIAGVPAARLTDASDPRSFEPFAFTVQPFVEQRSGVTILNNVIWPQRGDVTLLTYELQRAGVVTVQVFTLDGQLVSVLQRGRQAAGRQMVSWDGSNTSGQTVASGLYFIRVVGPDIDQIRKVIVAKE